eukprot:g19637.t1
MLYYKVTLTCSDPCTGWNNYLQAIFSTNGTSSFGDVRGDTCAVWGDLKRLESGCGTGDLGSVSSVLPGRVTVVMAYALATPEPNQGGRDFENFLKWFFMVYTSVQWIALVAWSLAVEKQAEARAFVLAWKIASEVSQAFDFSSSEMYSLTLFGIIGLEGVGIILAAIAFARNRDAIQDGVKGFVQLPSSEQAKAVLALAPRVRLARRGWAEGAKKSKDGPNAWFRQISQSAELDDVLDATNPYFSIQAAQKKVVNGDHGSYVLGGLLGHGAYGWVYKATDRNSGRLLVAKLIDIRLAESLESFHTEYRIWKHMQSCDGYPHPNVVQHIEVLKLSKIIGVVIMEHAAGGSLSGTLYEKVTAETASSGVRTKLGNALLTDEALAKKLFGQLAAGAQWLARCGVVHKDLKPDNIMLSKPFLEGGVLKIIDFGLAMLTRNKVATRTFDDFAVGLLLAEIGTGVPPYFNPGNDYGSTAEGNLQNEKGIFYILQHKTICDRGQAGLDKSINPKTDLAQGVVPIKQAVKEVEQRADLRTLMSWPWLQGEGPVEPQQLREPEVMEQPEPEPELEWEDEEVPEVEEEPEKEEDLDVLSETETAPALIARVGFFTTPVLVGGPTRATTVQYVISKWDLARRKQLLYVIDKSVPEMFHETIKKGSGCGSTCQRLLDADDPDVLKCLLETTVHEVGHTLGLRHNFIAAEDGRSSVPWVVRGGAGREQPVFGGHFLGSPGRYDHYAIRYGYISLEGETRGVRHPKLELLANGQQLDEELSSEARNPLFASDDDLGGFDPRVQQRAADIQRMGVDKILWGRTRRATLLDGRRPRRRTRSSVGWHVACGTWEAPAIRFEQALEYVAVVLHLLVGPVFRLSSTEREHLLSRREGEYGLSAPSSVSLHGAACDQILSRLLDPTTLEELEPEERSEPPSFELLRALAFGSPSTGPARELEEAELMKGLFHPLQPGARVAEMKAHLDVVDTRPPPCTIRFLGGGGARPRTSAARFLAQRQPKKQIFFALTLALFGFRAWNFVCAPKPAETGLPAAPQSAVSQPAPSTPTAESSTAASSTPMTMTSLTAIPLAYVAANKGERRLSTLSGGRASKALRRSTAAPEDVRGEVTGVVLPVLAALAGWLAVMYGIQHSLIAVPFLSGTQYEYFPIVATFIAGYAVIVLEEQTEINKAATALVLGVLIWALVGTGVDMDAAMFDTAIKENERPNRGSWMEKMTETLEDVSEVVFFLLGALTIVEIMDAHKGFDIITKAIQAKTQKELLIIIGVLTFVLSSVLNNLTVVIVMISLLQKLDEDFRMKLGGLVVVASNAGGAWTPIGDITTTMLYIGGQVTTVPLLANLFFPSVLCLVGTLGYEYLQMDDKPFDPWTTKSFGGEIPSEDLFGQYCGLFGMITVPVFTAITQCPAWSGMMLVLGLLGLITSLLHGPEDEKYSLKGALTRVEVPDALFFLGVLFAVGGLERVGLLKEFAIQLSSLVPYDALVAIFLGFASAVVDNVPLVAAAQGMYDLGAHPANDGLWNLITYCAATGGSLLVIGSAAGVAFMGMERNVSFGWYVKSIGPAALAGYFLGAEELNALQSATEDALACQARLVFCKLVNHLLRDDGVHALVRSHAMALVQMVEEVLAGLKETSVTQLAQAHWTLALEALKAKRRAAAPGPSGGITLSLGKRDRGGGFSGGERVWTPAFYFVSAANQFDQTFQK